MDVQYAAVRWASGLAGLANACCVACMATCGAMGFIMFAMSSCDNALPKPFTDDPNNGAPKAELAIVSNNECLSLSLSNELTRMTIKGKLFLLGKCPAIHKMS